MTNFAISRFFASECFEHFETGLFGSLVYECGVEPVMLSE